MMRNGGFGRGKCSGRLFLSDGRVRLTLAFAAAVSVFVLAAGPAVALSPSDIFWGNEFGDSIGSAAIDGTGANQSFITGPSLVCGVAVDGQHVYWGNGNAIGIANLNGTGVNQDFISTAAGLVAVNSQHIYWSTGSNTIARANLDGTGVNLNFITGADLPGGVAVDGQHIYWANINGASIGRANLDGTGVNQNFITGASTPEGVAVNGQHIYWGNFDSTIGEANLDGTGVNQSLIPAAGVRGIAVDDQHVYWTDQTNNQIGEANLDGTGVNASFITGANTPCGVAVSVPVANVSPATPAAFGTTPQGTLSAPLTLTVSNTGQRNLTISGLTVAGPDPGDFIVSPGGCMGPVAPEESCQLTVNFAPQAPGARTATLAIATNDYANSPMQIPLSGTAGSLPQGPPGSQGQQGLAGPQGPKGPAGKIQLITCKSVTKKVNGHPRKVQKCTGRLVSGPVRFIVGASDRATVTRGRITYATGTSVQVGAGRRQLVLHDLRPLHRGSYMLTLRAHHRQGWVTTRLTITIG